MVRVFAGATLRTVSLQSSSSRADGCHHFIAVVNTVFPRITYSRLHLAIID